MFSVVETERHEQTNSSFVLLIFSRPENIASFLFYWYLILYHHQRETNQDY